MTVLLLMRLGSYFLGGRAFVFQAELYVGLLMFIGYVLFDTQVSLARWRFLDSDYVHGTWSITVCKFAYVPH